MISTVIWHWMHCHSALPYTNNRGKWQNLMQKKFLSGEMNFTKTNRFSAEEAKNYIPCTEKRKKVPKCTMLEFSGSLSSSMLPILSWKLKITAYRGSSTIPPSSKLERLCQYKITRIFTKNSIIDDMGVPDPPLVCLFSMRNITKNNKTYRSRHLHVQSQKEGY